MQRNNNACRLERNLQAHTETEYAVENRCYAPTQRTEKAPRSGNNCSQEKLWFRPVQCTRWAVVSQPTPPHTERNYREHVKAVKKKSRYQQKGDQSRVAKIFWTSLKKEQRA